MKGRFAELPANWAMFEIGQLVTPCGTRNPQKESPGLFKYVDVGAVDNLRQAVADAKVLPRAQAPSRARMLLKAGDVIFCLVRPYLKNIAVIPLGLEGEVASTAYCVLRPVPAVDTKFLFHQVTSNSFVGAVPTYGTSPPSARDSEFLALKLAIAPLAEQRRIVAKIEELFSELDAGVAALERVKANLKRYRAAVLKAAVEGKLTAEWRKKNPPTETGEQLLKRIIAARQKKWEEDQLKKFAQKDKTPPKDWQAVYTPPVPPDPECPMLDISEGWARTSLDGVTRNFDGLRRPVRSADRSLRQGRYPYYGASGVIDTIDDFIFDGTFLLIGEDGANLVSRSTPIAFRASGRFWVNNHAHILQALGGIPLTFIELYINSVRLDRWVTGTAQPKLNQANLNKIPIPLPPLPEQHQIVAEVERRLSVADAVAVEVEHSLKRAASLRQAILKRAFAGKLVAQDPADEPASVLLERIKAERAATMNRPAKAQTPKTRPTRNIATPAQNVRKLSRKIWLARATIAAYGVNALADQPTFGRVQLQKFLYLAQAHIGLDLQFQFEKQAAGPFDKDIYKIEFNAKQQEWFYPTGNRSDAASYQPGPEIQDRLIWAGRMFKKQLPEIDKLIEHLRGMNTQQAELFATIHAVWSELLVAGKTCSVDEIVKGVHAWHESKKRFMSAQIEKCMQWMCKEGYVPTGI